MIRYLYLLKSGDLCKIGITDNITKRLKTYTTHNPNFELYREYSTDKAQSIELAVKSMLKPYQVPGRSEWFTTPIDSVVRLIEYLLNESYAVEPVAPKPDARFEEFAKWQFKKMFAECILTEDLNRTKNLDNVVDLAVQYIKMFIDANAKLDYSSGGCISMFKNHRVDGGSRYQLVCKGPIVFYGDVTVSCTIQGETLSAGSLYSPRYVLSLSDADPSKLPLSTKLPLRARDLEDSPLYQELGLLDCTNHSERTSRYGYCNLTLVQEFTGIWGYEGDIPIALLYECHDIVKYPKENWISADNPEEALDNIHLAAVLLLDWRYACRHIETTLGKYKEYSRPLRIFIQSLQKYDEGLDFHIEALFCWLEENIYDRQPDVDDPDFEDQESHFINLIAKELLEIRRLRQHDKVVLNYSFKSS